MAYYSRTRRCHLYALPARTAAHPRCHCLPCRAASPLHRARAHTHAALGNVRRRCPTHAPRGLALLPHAAAAPGRRACRCLHGWDSCLLYAHAFLRTARTHTHAPPHHTHSGLDGLVCLRFTFVVTFICVQVLQFWYCWIHICAQTFLGHAWTFTAPPPPPTIPLDSQLDSYILPGLHSCPHGGLSVRSYRSGPVPFTPTHGWLVLHSSLYGSSRPHTRTPHYPCLLGYLTRGYTLPSPTHVTRPGRLVYDLLPFGLFCYTPVYT